MRIQHIRTVYKVACAENVSSAILAFSDTYEVTDRSYPWKLNNFLCNYNVHLQALSDTPVNHLHVAGAGSQQ